MISAIRRVHGLEELQFNAATADLEVGLQIALHAMVSYQVGSNAEGHRSFSTRGAKLFVVD